MEAIDLGHLSRQTGGDKRLEREVLTLFVADVPAQFRQLGSADVAERLAIAHRIVGAARAIGATAVADEAAAIATGAGDLGRLEAAIEAACRFLERHLAASA